MDPAQDEESRFAPALAAFRERSERLRPAVAELQALSQRGELTVSLPDLGASLVHMHANRLLRSGQRAQELVLYDFLARLYRTQLARGRQ